MRKTIALLLILLFFTASCVIMAKPVFSSTDVAENTWVTKAPMHVARSNLGVAVVDGNIYAIGGLVGNGVVTVVNEVYDPETDTWSSRKSMPTARAYFATAVYQGKVYCIGGAGGANEVYDPATDSWTTEEPLPIATSDYPSAVVDNKIYVIGGLSSNPRSDLNQIYDAESGVWSEGALMPLGNRYGAAGATVGVNAPKRIYFISSGRTQVYDPGNDSWTFGADLPTRREGFGVAVVDDALYVIGGFKLSYAELYSIDVVVTRYAANEQYTPFGYGTVPPAVSVVSPENMTYETSNVSLSFTVNKTVNWTGYSLDSGETVIVGGNATLEGLANGVHNVTVYAKDEFGNVGASEAVSFTVEVPFPGMLVVAPVASVAVVGAVLAIYFKKRKGH